MNKSYEASGISCIEEPPWHWMSDKVGSNNSDMLRLEEESEGIFKEL